MENLEKILNQVDEVNPYYADKLDLIIERALMDAAYANAIGFDFKAKSLIGLFIFTTVSKASGLDWAIIYNKVLHKKLEKKGAAYED